MKKISILWALLAALGSSAQSQITGTYSIGASGDFTDIHDAKAAIMAAGASGAVSFHFNGADTVQMSASLEGLVDENSATTLYFFGHGITFVPDSMSYILDLVDANDLVFDGFNFVTSENEIAVLGSGTKDIEFKNCTFVCNECPQNVWIEDDYALPSRDIRIEACSFDGAINALHFKGFGGPGDVMENAVIYNCDISARDIGIYAARSCDLRIVGSKISLFGGINPSARNILITLNDCWFYVSQDTLINTIGSSLEVSNSEPTGDLAMIANNFFLDGDVSSSSDLLKLSFAENIHVAYNTAVHPNGVFALLSLGAVKIFNNHVVADRGLRGSRGIAYPSHVAGNVWITSQADPFLYDGVFYTLEEWAAAGYDGLIDESYGLSLNQEGLPQDFRICGIGAYYPNVTWDFYGNPRSDYSTPGAIGCPDGYFDAVLSFRDTLVCPGGEVYPTPLYGADHLVTTLDTSGIDGFETVTLSVTDGNVTKTATANIVWHQQTGFKPVSDLSYSDDHFSNLEKKDGFGSALASTLHWSGEMDVIAIGKKYADPMGSRRVAKDGGGVEVAFDYGDTVTSVHELDLSLAEPSQKAYTGSAITFGDDFDGNGIVDLLVGAPFERVKVANVMLEPFTFFC